MDFTVIVALKSKHILPLASTATPISFTIYSLFSDAICLTSFLNSSRTYCGLSFSGFSFFTATGHYEMKRIGSYTTVHTGWTKEKCICLKIPLVANICGKFLCCRRVSAKVCLWLTRGFRYLSASRDRLKLAAVRSNPAISKGAYKQTRNRVNRSNKTTTFY